MEGKELRAAAAQHREMAKEVRSRLSVAEISAEQSKQAARDAQSKLYQYRYNVRKRKHGADEADCEAADESCSESAESGDNNNSGEEPTQRLRRNHPKGLQYKLRRAAPVSKDNIDAYIRARRGELEQCLTTMFGVRDKMAYDNAIKVCELFFKPYHKITHAWLMSKWCSQGLEALHQWVHFFGRHRCNKQKQHAAAGFLMACTMRAFSARTKMITAKGAAMRARATVTAAAELAASGVARTKFTREHKSKHRVHKHVDAVEALDPYRK
eukprot:jgi/Tetstr1/458555/TSEL_044958.t1